MGANAGRLTRVEPAARLIAIGAGTAAAIAVTAAAIAGTVIA